MESPSGIIGSLENVDPRMITRRLTDRLRFIHWRKQHAEKTPCRENPRIAYLKWLNKILDLLIEDKIGMLI